jgi:hypothetical protein
VIRKADVLLVFAHSEGEMVEHEVSKAREYGVPIIAVVDPVREQEKYRRTRTKLIQDSMRCEVGLDDPEEIVRAIRTYARAQVTVDQSLGSLEPAALSIEKPNDIATTIRERMELSPVGEYLVARAARSADRDTAE